MTDWIEWSGGDCPVDKLALVEVRFPGGVTDTDVADAYDWQHDGRSSDIVAYRPSATLSRSSETRNG